MRQRLATLDKRILKKSNLRLRRRRRTPVILAGTHGDRRLELTGLLAIITVRKRFRPGTEPISGQNEIRT